MKVRAIASAWLKPRELRLPDHNGTGTTINESGKAIAVTAWLSKLPSSFPAGLVPLYLKRWIRLRKAPSYAPYAAARRKWGWVRRHIPHKAPSSPFITVLNSFSPHTQHRGPSSGTICARQGSQTGRLAMVVRGEPQIRHSEGNRRENKLDEAALTALFIASRNCVVRWGTPWARSGALLLKTTLLKRSVEGCTQARV